MLANHSDSDRSAWAPFARTLADRGYRVLAFDYGFSLPESDVAAEELEGEVEALADKMALIDVDLLAANKRIVNMAMELMGARTMQRMAAERDAIGRQSPVVHEFYRRAKDEGLKAALEWRDSNFGGG